MNPKKFYDKEAFKAYLKKHRLKLQVTSFGAYALRPDFTAQAFYVNPHQFKQVPEDIGRP